MTKPGAILKHSRLLGQHHSRRLWLFSGTGDGPALARDLLEQGWQLRVSVVREPFSHAYPEDPCLELRVGPLGGSAALVDALTQARRQQRPFRAVIDATHPFACRISRELVEGCATAALPLLALVRPTAAALAPVPELSWLDDLAALQTTDLAGRRLLLAIGARQLGEAVRVSAGALHHARVLPRPQALQQALAAGLALERIACLQPDPAGAGGIEAALVERWAIDTIVARQSGPPMEVLWRHIAAACSCRLLLLRQPALPGGLAQGREQLLDQLAALIR
jgi:precorrin-6A/cobalt-precorrin-6A reductase